MNFIDNTDIPQRYFKSVSWCNLRILLLRIHANYDWNKTGMVATQITRPVDIIYPNCPIVDIYLLEKTDEFPFNRHKTYRESVMENGFYIGHHFGSPARVYQKSLDCFILQADQADRIIWSYITKYLLTIYCDKLNLLHLKAAAIEYNNNLFLVCGRGNHGKTTFVESVCKSNESIHFFSNTHVLIDACGNGIRVPSNVRYRSPLEGEKYISTFNFIHKQMDSDFLPIKGIFWIDYSDTSTQHVASIDDKQSFIMMYHFAAAVGNWELKEDISDYAGNIISASEFFQREYNRLSQFVKSIPFYYVTNIKNVNVLNETLKLIKKEE